MSTPYFYTFPMSAVNAKGSTTNITVGDEGDEMPPTNPNPPGGRM